LSYDVSLKNYDLLVIIKFGKINFEFSVYYFFPKCI
jgi:hypothetical protein